MRHLLALTLLSAAPAMADTFEVRAPVSAVTLYPVGATVVREVTLAAPAGVHQVLVAGLPQAMTAEGLRVTAPEGVTVGAMSLAEARPPAVAEATSPAVEAARAALRQAEAALREGRRGVAEIRARGEAAEVRLGFLQQLALRRPEAAPAPTVEELRSLATMIEEETRAARAARVLAEDEAVAAELALEPLQRAVSAAQTALAALLVPGADDGQVLTLTVAVEVAGEVTLTVSGLVGDATWAPVYDLYLTRGPDALRIARGVLVAQATGEDWSDVALTLSTATPSEQAAPSRLWPELRRIEEPVAPDRRSVAGGAPAGAMLDEPVVEAAAVAGFGFDGDSLGQVFTWTFGAPVSVRSGADALRLSMDEVAAGVAVRAEAVPIFDSTAFLVAKVTNTSGQPLLPGPATLHAEGTLVGLDELPLLPAGDETDLGFGPIPGLRLTRTIPAASEGTEGVFATANKREETAVIRIENLTGEDWPVRLVDRVPYSEQDDLRVSWEAVPMPAEEDPDGQRGILVWTFDLPAGEASTIRLTHRLDWPEGMDLR